MTLSRNTAKYEALPKGWRRRRLNTVASVKTGPFGAQLHQHDYVQSNGTPIVTVEHLNERGLIHKNLPLVSYHDKQRLSQYLIREGDIVFSRVGSVDRSALVSKNEDGWLFSGRLLRVRPERDDVYSSYLNYFFHTRKFRHHMKSIAVGGTMPSINTDILSNVIICLPPVDEQKAIASLLETWDTAIGKIEALIAAKEKQFKWLLKTLISDQEGNNGWQRVRLNTVASVKTGPFGAQLHQHDYVQSNGTPIVTVEHLSERELIHKNLPLVSYHDKQRLSQYLIREGDIVFSRVGSVDRSALVSKDEDGWLFSGRLLRVRPERDDVYSSYLNYFFHTQKFRHHMKSIAVGGTMPSINTNILSNVIVPLPSMEKQKAIASLLETWDTTIKKTKALAEQYRIQKRGLMQKLLTGKWRIQLGDN